MRYSTILDDLCSLSIFEAWAVDTTETKENSDSDKLSAFTNSDGGSLNANYPTILYLTIGIINSLTNF